MKPQKINLSELADRVFARYDDYPRLQKAERVLICVWALEGEVDNGGFDQYYFNSAGDHALDTPGALEAIGAKQAAAIVKKANLLFGEPGPSPDRFKRQKQMDSFTEETQSAMSALDQDFYKCSDSLERLLTEYVDSHRDVFLPDHR